MNSPDLLQLASIVELDHESNFTLRVAFGIACIERVEHLLTNSSVNEAFSIGKRYLSGECSRQVLNDASLRASELARSHPGSGSIDGANSAAVTTSHGVAMALAGKALEAAGYAAYASVYSYASYAVTDISAYKSEHDWQLRILQSLADDIT